MVGSSARVFLQAFYRVIGRCARCARDPELYDPSGGSFSYTGSLNDERDGGERAVSLDSDAVLMLGGEWNYHIYRPYTWNTADLYQ